MRAWLLLLAAVTATADASTVTASARRPISGSAFHAAEAAYRAYAAGRFDDAAAKAAISVKLRPDIPRLRLLLVRALRGAGRNDLALAAARSAIASQMAGPELRAEMAAIGTARRSPASAYTAVTPGPPLLSGFSQAQRGYDALARGDASGAAEAAAQAVQASPSDPAYRLLLVDALSATGRLADAEAAAAEALAARAGSGALRGRQAQLLLRLGRGTEASRAFEAALSTEADPQVRRTLSLGLFDARSATGSSEAALAALSPLQDDTHYDVASRRAEVLVALARREEALAAVRTARKSAPDAAESARQVLAELYLLSDLGRHEEARTLLRLAASQPLLASNKDVEAGELAERNGDDATALIFFERAQAAGRLAGAPRLDAAYVAKRRVRNEMAISLFDATLADGSGLELSPERRYRLGREATELARTWGVNASVLAGAVNFPSALNGGGPVSNPRVVQAGGEVYWRPPVIGYRDGRTVELFGRVFSTLDDQTGGPTGGDSVQGYLGARWKPMSRLNLVFEASRLIKLGDASRNDWLLRAAYSQEHGLEIGEPRASRPMWQVYGELDRLTETPQTLAFAEARAGWLFRLDRVNSRLTMSPVLDAAYSFDDRAGTNSALGIGPALAFRYWMPGGRWGARGSYVELVAGGRFRLAGAERAGGPFATFSLVY